MKKFFITLLLLTAPLFATAGISINVGEPDYYGEIYLGDMRPQLVYSYPTIIHKHETVREPLYLRVPPGHYKNWRYYCARYNACGRPVYFVKDDWYHNHYRKHHHGHGRDRDWDGDRGYHRGHHKHRHHKYDD